MSSPESMSTIDLFEMIFNILDKHGLIKHSEMNEEKKNALMEFIRYAENQHGETQGLKEKLRNILSTLKFEPISTTDLKSMIDEIEQEIAKLKATNSTFHEIVTTQEQRIKELEKSNEVEKAHLIAYDALLMFIFYYVEPAIRIHNPNWIWRDFTSECKLILI